MPIRVTSFYLPASTSIPYILEDVYIRGGMRSVATTADRDAIPAMARKAGMIVYCRDDGNYYKLATDLQTWLLTNIAVKSGGSSGGNGGTSGGNGAGVRYTQSFAVPTLDAGASVNLTLKLNTPTAMILSLALDAPDIKVQVYSKADMSDGNPYTFISNATQLSDIGLSTTDGTTSRVRRYSFWATEDDSVNHLAVFTNLGLSATTVNVKLTYLTME